MYQVQASDSSASSNAAPQEQSADFQVLIHAVSSCAGPAVLQIIQNNPSIVNQKGWSGNSPLHRACLSGDTNIVRLLCEHGADPNARNDFQETPVHYASKRGIPTLVHILLKYGGKIDVKDAAGKTPIHNAAETGSVYMLKYFEDQGYSFRDVDDKGFTTLHHVCTYGHLDAFKFLLRKGRTDAAAANKAGDTALHLCVREGYAHGSWILINLLGVSCINVPNKDGLTPVDIIKQFSSSRKDGHIMLTPFLTDLAANGNKTALSGPIRSWYFNLTMPTIVFLLAIFVAHYVLTELQGFVYILAVGYIVKTGMVSSHRLHHLSRWSNPMMAGTFAAGMFHTMLVFYCSMADSTTHPILLMMVVTFNIIQLYTYYQLLKADPGVVVTSIVNEKTGRPTQIIELCEAGAPLDSFCVDCEIIKTKVTKHCKLCDKCYYRMDHHCLFLLKCVGYNNHTRFVWFLIITVVVMSMFVTVSVLWAFAKYPDYNYTAMLLEMFWRDCWVLCMVFLNAASIVWVTSLIQYQLKVVANGNTTYFQHSVSYLTGSEKLLNVTNFLRGKPPYASGIAFENYKKSGMVTKQDVLNV